MSYHTIRQSLDSFKGLTYRTSFLYNKAPPPNVNWLTADAKIRLNYSTGIPSDETAVTANVTLDS